MSEVSVSERSSAELLREGLGKIMLLTVLLKTSLLVRIV